MAAAAPSARLALYHKALRESRKKESLYLDLLWWELKKNLTCEATHDKLSLTVGEYLLTKKGRYWMNKAYIATVKGKEIELYSNGAKETVVPETYFFTSYHDAHDFCNRMMDYDWCLRASVSYIWNGFGISLDNMSLTEITYFERA
jgi:hypothetical protein